MLSLQSSYALTLCWKGKLIELEEYLLDLITHKIEAALADQDVSITSDELLSVVSLAIEYTLSSKAMKIHRGVQ